jgi:hypothetical protein
MSNKNSFVLYKDYEELFDRLSDEEAGQLIKAIFDYERSGELPELPRLLEFILLPIKNTLDRDSDKYDKIVEKRRKAGAMGGKVAQANALKNEQMLDNSSTRVANQADSVSDTDSDSDTDSVSVTDTVTDTTTTSSDSMQPVVVVSDDNGSFYTDIWKSITPQDVDRIYEAFPDSGGDLIQTVHDDVKRKRKQIKRPVPYILGYAKRVGWDDKADHFEEVTV